ncbi:MAG TPA: metalloregulator ArsR/SmtB family transcription factor [Paraburkholderia sp.]|jgi:DNA-binding transcriptional ArsR family regulator|nr:metalloregulator ArsR/SmtB family transcription factor [Paraburkholderia sp.]
MTPNTPSGFDKLTAYAQEAAELLRVLGNVNRLQLLCQIAAGERSVGQLEDELEIKQPALSQQLAELRKAGVVKTRRESRSIYYSLEDVRARAILDVMRSLFCDGIAPASTPASAPVCTPADDASPGDDSPAATGDTARFARLGK